MLFAVLYKICVTIFFKKKEYQDIQVCIGHTLEYFISSYDEIDFYTKERKLSSKQ